MQGVQDLLQRPHEDDFLAASLGIEEIFYIVKEMRSERSTQIARDLDRDYEAVHKVQDVSGDVNEFNLYGVCEADEVYVTAGEEGLEDKDGNPRKRGLKKRGTFESDKPPMLTLVRHLDRRVRFLVRDDLQDADEDIAEYGDGSVILCSDSYTIYDDIEDKEREGRGGRPSGRHPLRHLRDR